MTAALAQIAVFALDIKKTKHQQAITQEESLVFAQLKHNTFSYFCSNVEIFCSFLFISIAITFRKNTAVPLMATRGRLQE